jgi:hypothetical protein
VLCAELLVEPLRFPLEPELFDDLLLFEPRPRELDLADERELLRRFDLLPEAVVRALPLERLLLEPEDFFRAPDAAAERRFDPDVAPARDVPR